MIPVPDIYSMKMLDLALPGVSVNDGGLTAVTAIPFPDGADVVQPPDPVSGSVPTAPLVL